MGESTVFSWNRDDLQHLLRTCTDDQVSSFVQKYFKPGGRILESGCGLARYVRYLSDRGWVVVGLEISHTTVAMVHDVWPDLYMVQGDSAHCPFPDDCFDGVLSLGVVEHWTQGPEPALREIYRVMRPGGYGIVTVPVLNTIRRLKRTFWIDEVLGLPRAVAATFLKGRALRLTRIAPSRYAVWPAYGAFFEYRMTTREFSDVVRSVGLQIVEHLPMAEIDGVFHDLNPFGCLVKFRDWRFKASRVALWLNRLLRRRPYTHCHMQAVVVRKA